MHTPIGAVNFLSGPYLDRRAMLRDDAGWHLAARQDPGTLFVLARGTAQLVHTQTQPRIAFVSAGHPLVVRAAESAMLLLGWYREARCVLVELAADGELPAGLLPPGARFEELRPLTPLLDADEAGLLAYARALSWWRAKHRFCSVCGSAALPRRAGHAIRCTAESCLAEFFPRIDPAIIVLVHDETKALLGRQASWPAGRYSTIAGFVEPGESLEDAVAREVAEETGVHVTSARYHSSQPWPFPSSLMLGFLAAAAPGEIACADAELEDARWFTREQIARGEPLLPPRTSISWRLIEHWFDAGSDRPLAASQSQPW